LHPFINAETLNSEFLALKHKTGKSARNDAHPSSMPTP